MQNLLYYFLCITLLLPFSAIKADDFQECESVILRSSCCSDSSNCCDNSCIKYKKARAFCALFAKELQVKNSGFISNLTTQQMLVSGNETINGNLTVIGEIFSDSELISGDLTITGNLTVDGTSTLTGAVTTGGDLTVGDDLTVTDNLTVNGSVIFNVDGAASLEPNVVTTVTNTAAFGPTVRVGQAIYTNTTTPFANTSDLIITADLITATSAVLLSVTNLAITGPNILMGIQGVILTDNTLTVRVRNNAANTQNPADHIIVTFWVLN